MRKALIAIGFVIGIFSIIMSIFLGFGFQAAEPPSDDACWKVYHSAQNGPTNGALLVKTVESKTLDDLMKIAMLSRKEYNSMSKLDALYRIALLVTGVSLVIALNHITTPDRKRG